MSTPKANFVLQTRQTLPKSGKDVIIVSLNRPDRLNCFNTAVCDELSKIISEIKADDDTLAAVIFTGEGTSFCAGADLSDPPNAVLQSSDILPSSVQNPVDYLTNLPLPVIAALKGHVITGGMELALACDILVGDETVCFRDTHVKFHLAPCWGLSQRLSRRIGSGRAKWVSLGAIPIPAPKAYEWGLLDELVLANDYVNEPQQGNNPSLNRALEIADSIGMNSSTMVLRYNRAIDEGWKTTLEQGLQRERSLALAHYIEAVRDGSTFESAKSFITTSRHPNPRL